jgi:predicted phosphodiesterase
VALVPSVMPTANCTPLLVDNVFTGQNQIVLFGGGMDVNPTFPTALGITCKIPASTAPVLYDLAIGFKTIITPKIQHEGGIDLIPHIGSWRGSVGSGSSGLFTGSIPFLLTEPNAISIPWQYDAFSSDGMKTYGGKAVKSFTIMHVTDTHYDPTQLNWMQNNSLWENDSSVIDPDVILFSGDLMENPGASDSHGAAQYDTAYARLTGLNSPIVMVSGNHDNRNLGLWKHYFGPLFSSTRFDDVKVVGFDSSLPVGSGILDWIDQEASLAVPGGPVLLMCHYNIDPSYFQSGWVGIADMMIQKNLTAILVGHTHSDMVGSVARLRDTIFSNAGLLLDGGERALMDKVEAELETTNQTISYLHPIRDAQILMTRTASKRGDTIVPVQNFTEQQLTYSGYRLATIQDNLVSNYTYDLDGDGIRDPQVSFPSGLFRTSVIKDASIGTSTSAGATWILNNTGNENLRAARAIFLIPNAPANYHWNLVSGNLTSAFIRTRITNGTHWWIDARVPSTRHSIVSLKIVPEHD